MKRAKNNRKTQPRPRNWVVLLMVENTKNTTFKDRRKEESKKKCRGSISTDE